MPVIYQHMSQRTRRELLCVVGTASVGVIAGCAQAPPPAVEVVQTRLVYQQDTVGVLFKFDDLEPTNENTVTVHVELLSDEDNTIAEQERSVSPVKETSTYTIWFENISPATQTEISEVSVQASSAD
jgi:hypothetical protein